ncbi:MAG: hypothetical protein SVY10_18045 [Thermodesulfobacteriota bacterium]|nr:hypothetical protein [Thermodesulfobacteriota bacterium]
MLTVLRILYVGTCTFDQIGFALILAPLWTVLLVIFYPRSARVEEGSRAATT